METNKKIHFMSVFFEMVEAIPLGKAATYGQIRANWLAAVAGNSSVLPWLPSGMVVVEKCHGSG